MKETNEPQLTKSLRCCITPGPDLRINEVGIPEHIYYGYFKRFMNDTYNYAVLIKRDPVINRLIHFSSHSLSVKQSTLVFVH